MKIASPGKVPIHHHWKYCAPSATIEPHSALRRLRAEAEEREAGEKEDRVREVERREHEHRPGDVRQHVAEQRPARRGAEQPSGLDVLALADGKHEAANDACVDGPRDDDDRERGILQTTAEHGRDDHREDDRGEREEQVDHAHETPSTIPRK